MTTGGSAGELHSIKVSEVMQNYFANFIKTGNPKTVYDWIRDAHEQGAKLWACPANLDLFDMEESDLIPECEGMMGAAAMIQDIMDGECRVLTY